MLLSPHKTIALLALLAQTPTTPNSVISLAITNLKSSKGQVGCRLFNAPKGFPIEEEAALQIKWAATTGGESRLSFDPVPAGVYAIACFHDENGNGKYDLGLLGIPLEGSVASNDAKGVFGPPSFKDAKFSFSGTPLELQLKMTY